MEAWVCLMLLGPEKPCFCNKNAQNSTFEAFFERGPKNVEILISSEKMFFADIFFENFESFWKIEFQIRARRAIGACQTTFFGRHLLRHKRDF